MRSVFNMDGPLFTFLSRVADILILNLLFILCSLPIFTIGASLTAMAYITLKMAEKRESYIVRPFFEAFKANFKQATLIWLILLAVGVIIGVDFYVTAGAQDTLWRVMRIILYIAAVFWMMIVLYVFPLLARFENSLLGTLRNALLLSLANAPRTLLVIAAIIAGVVCTLWNPTTLSYGILIWLLFGFALISLLNSTLQLKMFHQLAPPEEDDTDGDAWEIPDTEEDKEDR